VRFGRRVKVAFVATGGAARGIAHLGVLYACEALGIRPEIFVGTSAGAIVAATYGQNMPLDLLLDGYRLPWRHRLKGPHFGPLAYFGLPSMEELRQPRYLASGLLSMRRFEAQLRRYLPVNDFRDLPYTVLVSAVDIDRAQRIVFGTGYLDTVPISAAVAASCSVPGLFRPYRIGDAYFLDGEVVRTLSADLALRAGADVVIISSIYPPVVRKPSERSFGRQSALKVLSQSLNIVLTEKEHTGVALHEKDYPYARFVDLTPDIGSFGYLDGYAAGRPLIMRAYRTAMRKLAAAQATGAFGEVAPPSVVGYRLRRNVARTDPTAI
jgi:NTE family protein